nr:retrotransposon protein, putative, Ty1-copia subclass [Tanacetum cinerariifolium]
MTNETNVTAPVYVTGVPVTNTVANHAEKQKKINGQNFKRWQQKVFFYLTTLNLARFLKEIAPQVEPSKEDDLYNVYCKTMTAKELWESLEQKYKTEDDGTKKFAEMSVEDVIVHLRIEDDNKLAQKNTYAPDSAKADMVEHVGSSSKSNSKAKRKGKKKNNKKGKGKLSHHAANCKMPKRVNPRQANMVNDNMDMIAMVSDVIAMISEVNMVGSNNNGCGENMYMGNSATADIKGERDVILKMTSKKELKLTNVFKYEAIDKFVLYKTKVENQLGRKIKVVRSDRGGEYVSSFVELYVKHGIRHDFTAHYSPQQNGIAERKNRTLKEMVNAMLISSGLSQDMWGEAILTATYLLNNIPSKVVVPTPKAQKIGPKFVDYIFIGYAMNSGAYRFIVHDSKNPDIQKSAVMESKNASFFENIFPGSTKETGSSSRLDDEVFQDKRQRDDNDLHDERQYQLEEEEVEPRRSKRARTEKSFGPDFVSFMVENEPTSYREAVICFVFGRLLKSLAFTRKLKAKRKSLWKTYDRPNIVTGSNVQDYWEKFTRYFEVDLKEVKLIDGFYMMRFERGEIERRLLHDGSLIKAVEMMDEISRGMYTYAD